MRQSLFEGFMRNVEELIEKVKAGELDPQSVSDVLARTRDKQFLSNTRSWYAWRKGIVCTTLTSHGTTPKGWLKRFNGQGVFVSSDAKMILEQTSSKPTKAGTDHCVVIINASFFLQAQIMKNKLEGVAPDINIACLLRESFSGTDLDRMGFNAIYVVHEPFMRGRCPIVLRVVYDHMNFEEILDACEVEGLGNGRFGRAGVAFQVKDWDSFKKSCERL